MTTLNPVSDIGRQMSDIQYRPLMGNKNRVSAPAKCCAGRHPGSSQRMAQYPHQSPVACGSASPSPWRSSTGPDLLIADEPTTALDATLEMQIISLMKALGRKIISASSLISHHLAVVAELCHNIIVMYAGEIVERGSMNDVFYRPAHPYTQLLLECDPARMPETSGMLKSIPG